MSESSTRVSIETRSQKVTRAVLGLALLALGVFTLQNFLPALAWAAIFAIAVWPLYWRVRRRFPPTRHEILLPFLFTAMVALVFMTPLALVAVPLAREAHNVIGWVHDFQANGLPQPDWLARLPGGTTQAQRWWHENLADPESSSALLGRLISSDLVTFSRQAASQLAHRTVLFGFTLLTLFFLFRYGTNITALMIRVSERLLGPRGERVGRQIVGSVHGTVDGLVLVGLGEGVLLGIAYASVGVPHPTLFGALTAIAAMIPFGAPAAYGLVSLILLANAQLGAAIFVFVFGSVVLFIADHFIRPALIGGATKLPFLWVLLGILGGVEEWGLLGLFLGPAIMAALMMLWRELAEDTGETT